MANDGVSMNFDDLSVSDVASEVERINLDGVVLKAGKREIDLTGQWIDVRSVESDEFKSERLRLQRLASTKSKKKMSQHELDEIEHGMFAVLIAGWSFDNPCTLENRIKAVKTWPQTLISLIDKTASEMVVFQVGKVSS